MGVLWAPVLLLEYICVSQGLENINMKWSNLVKYKEKPEVRGFIDSVIRSWSYQQYIFVTSEPQLHVMYLTAGLPDNSTYMMFSLEYRNLSSISSDIEYIFTSSNLRSTLFIVSCSARCAKKLFVKVRQLETIENQGPDWLVFITQVTTGCSGDPPVIILETIILCSSSEADINFNWKPRMVSYRRTRCGIYKNSPVTAHDEQTVADMLFPDQYGLNNRILRVAILPWAPFVYKTTTHGFVEYSGANIDFITELSKALNFSIHYVEPSDGEWGQQINGRWTGLVGLVVNKSVDLVVAPVVATAERYDVMDFTMPYYYDGAVLLLKPPTSEANAWQTLISPLSLAVHLCIFMGLIATAIFLSFLQEVGASLRNDKCMTWTGRLKTLGNLMLSCFAVLLQQGGMPVQRQASGVLAFGFWCFFSMVVAAIYRGNLIAFLTDHHTPLPFTSVADMVEQDTYTWGLVNGTSFVTMFKGVLLMVCVTNGKTPVGYGCVDKTRFVVQNHFESRLPEFMQIWKSVESRAKTDNEILSLSDDVHHRKVLREKYVYICDLSSALLRKTKNCDLQIVRAKYASLNYALGLGKDSSLTPVFSKMIQKWFDNGLISMLFDKWMPKPRCGTNLNKAKRVDLPTLIGVFYVLSIGVTLGSCGLLAELVLKWKRQSRSVKSSLRLHKL